MEKFIKGDVVVIPFPFSDLTQTAYSQQTAILSSTKLAVLQSTDSTRLLTI